MKVVSLSLSLVLSTPKAIGKGSRDVLPCLRIPDSGWVMSVLVVRFPDAMSVGSLKIYLALFVFLFVEMAREDQRKSSASSYSDAFFRANSRIAYALRGVPEEGDRQYSRTKLERKSRAFASIV